MSNTIAFALTLLTLSCPHGFSMTQQMLYEKIVHHIDNNSLSILNFTNPNKLTELLAEHEPLSGQDRIDLLFHCLHQEKHKVALILLSSWKNCKNCDTTDLFSQTCSRQTYPYCLFFNSIVQEQIDHYKGKSLFDFADTVLSLRKLYVYICTNFRDAIPINQKDIYDENPLQMVLKEYIRYKGPPEQLKILLEHLISTFRHSLDLYIPDKYHQTALDICIILPNDSTTRVHHKQICQALLKKYFPDKLILTKQRLEKLHNCHFAFYKP